jgi:hypothetical protein
MSQINKTRSTSKSALQWIRLDDAFAVLERCAVLATDYDKLVVPATSTLTGDGLHIFATFLSSSAGKASGTREVKFMEGSNRRVRVSDNAMTFVDTDGNDVTVRVLGYFDVATFARSQYDSAVCVGAVMEYLTMSAAQIRLMCGEMTMQEIRSVRAVLRAILEKSKHSEGLNGNRQGT